MSFLEKLGQKFANAIASRIHAPDPASFGDPVALRTSWSPLKKGGSSFRTQKLVERAPGQPAHPRSTSQRRRRCPRPSGLIT